MTNSFNSIAAACALAALATAATAGIRAYHVRASNFSFSTPTALLPLNAAGQTTITWNQTNRGRKVLTFSAECSIDAPAGNASAWLDLDIIHNGATQPPTVGPNDAFCSSNGVAGFGGFTHPSVTIVVDAVAGANTLSILARLNAGGTAGWIGDSTLVIHD